MPPPASFSLISPLRAHSEAFASSCDARDHNINRGIDLHAVDLTRLVTSAIIAKQEKELTIGNDRASSRWTRLGGVTGGR